MSQNKEQQPVTKTSEKKIDIEAWLIRIVFWTIVVTIFLVSLIVIAKALSYVVSALLALLALLGISKTQ